ncbi:hypothetical protein [Pseudomonas sp. S13.1.2]|uniref:hypothetical protein n=1 Tax=Pseudomonas sp. S13.1.2 TaxID=1217722 RepID=UPI0015A6A39A|nr:hypothetical protein [Pseudomonas sp. S13.1.2]
MTTLRLGGVTHTLQVGQCRIGSALIGLGVGRFTRRVGIAFLAGLTGQRFRGYA